MVKLPLLQGHRLPLRNHHRNGRHGGKLLCRNDLDRPGEARNSSTWDCNVETVAILTIAPANK